MEMFLPHEDGRLLLARLPLSINGVRAGFGSVSPELDADREELTGRGSVTQDAQ